jgi:hypothetical protein
MHRCYPLAVFRGEQQGQAVGGDHRNRVMMARNHTIGLDRIGHLIRLPFNHRRTVHLLADEHVLWLQRIIDRTKPVIDTVKGAEIVCLVHRVLSVL